MRRPAGLAALLAALVGIATVVAGCSTGGSSTEELPTVKAPPQTAELGWIENYPADQPALVFGVQSFTVTAEGWRAEISVQNRSDVRWKVAGPSLAADLQFGVMLFPTDNQKELEQRSRQNNLPAIRPATSYSPALPAVLRPGRRGAGRSRRRGRSPAAFGSGSRSGRS